MTKIRGWDRIYKGKPTKGRGSRRPVVMQWESVFGDEVQVERFHKWDKSGTYDTVVYPDEEDIPDNKDKWAVVFTDGEKLYFPKRKNAVDAARAFMRERYDESDLRAARAAKRRDEETPDVDPNLDTDEYSPKITEEGEVIH